MTAPALLTSDDRVPSLSPNDTRPDPEDPMDTRRPLTAAVFAAALISVTTAGLNSNGSI